MNENKKYNNIKDSTEFSPQQITLTLLIGTLTMSLLALMGWLSGNEALASIGTKFRPMAFSTSIILPILCWLHYSVSKPTLSVYKKILFQILIGLIGTYGLFTFLGNAVGLPIIPDKLFIDELRTILNTPIGSMASVTGFLVFLSSVNLMANLTDNYLINKLTNISAVLITFISFLFIVLYSIGSPLIYISDTFTITMAFTSALAFTMFGLILITKKYLDDDSFAIIYAKLISIKISTQLRLSFTAMLFLVSLLGIIAYVQTYEIHHQTEELYNHPLMVRRAIGALTSDVLQIRVQMRGLPLAKDENEVQQILSKVALYESDINMQLDTLRARYLGNKSDIDSLTHSLIGFNIIQQENIRVMRGGIEDEVIKRLHPNGITGQQLDKVLAKLEVIDNFARNKGNEFYAKSKELYISLTLQLIFLVIVILLLTLLIYNLLVKNIRKPLNELQNVTTRFHSGDYSARSSYEYDNEFGVLSNSYNILADNIQDNIELNEKVVTLSGLMLSEDNANQFFKETLAALALYTKSQIAAVYLLSEDKTKFEHFESIGSSSEIKESFSAVDLEGEFGAVISSGKLNHLKDIPKNTRFIFTTSSFDIIPQEILTIPIISGKEIIAIISLTSIREYSETSLKLINEVLDTLSARIAGILSYNKVREYSEKLSMQNAELEAQKNELTRQSAELTEQNTELEMQKNQLNEVSKLKTNFLSNMSHELRTPLNSVIALSGVLNRRLAKQIPDEEYSYLEVIERNGKHLLSLINDILDISRIEAGREEIEVTKFNMNEVIASTVSMIMPQAKEKNIELIHTNPNAEIFVNSDIHKVQHILQNLIGNAIKFTERGQVKVAVQFNNNQAKISVADTGIGIAEQNLEHIFDEFRQADGSTSRRFGGTGLGLAIAKKYTELLGGSISVDSNIGVGTTFTFDIPNINSTNYPNVSEVTHFDRKSKIKLVNDSSHDAFAKTILLVEDSEPAIIQIRDFLEQSGYKIIVARDGGEALEIISQSIPDAMVLDLMIPGIDGFELLATLRNADITADIPVLILTAKHITQDELKFLKRNNVHQLIQKGDVNRIELLNAVYSMIFPIKDIVIKPSISPQKIEGKPSVLVVEDNPDNMITVRALLSENYEIIEATDATAGIELAKTKLPNLILMDIALPGMDGIGAFRIIRNTPQLQHIPVVALTASAMTTDRESILAHGFDGYIAKPIDDKLFFKTLRMVIYGTQEN